MSRSRYNLRGPPATRPRLTPSLAPLADIFDLSPPSPEVPPAQPPPTLPLAAIPEPSPPCASSSLLLSTSCRSASPAAFDAEYYPTLIDAIFRHAPRESLLALRAVSQNFRFRADREFMRHLIIGPYRQLTTSRGPLPWPWSLTPDELFAHTRIMDVPGKEELPVFSVHKRACLVGLRTLRWRGRITLHRRFLPSCDELVVFSDQTYWTRFAGHAYRFPFALPSQVGRKRLVLRFWYVRAFPSEQCELRAGNSLLDLDTLPPEVVVIFSVASHPTSSFMLGRSYGEYRALTGRLGEWLATNDTSFVFVNAESTLCSRVPCSTEGGCTHLSGFKVDLYDAVHRHADAALVSPAAAVEGAMRRSTFLSLAEYESRVGEEQFRLHTHHPEDVGELEARRRCR